MDYTIPRSIAVLDCDGGYTHIKLMQFLVASKHFDLRAAIIAACTEFCNADEGMEIYTSNCCCFNWGDFDLYVPEDICRRHGFVKVNSHNTIEHAFFDEHLVIDEQVYSTQEQSNKLLKRFFLFPPLDGTYHIWNYTVQWLTDAELLQQDNSLIIHKTLNNAAVDDRIRKDIKDIVPNIHSGVISAPASSGEKGGAKE